MKKEFPIKFDLERIVSYLLTSVFITSVYQLIKSISRSYGFQMNEIQQNFLLVFTIMSIAITFYYLVPLFTKLIFPQKIKCEYVAIELEDTGDTSNPSLIKIEKMYQKLTELIKKAKSVKIVDNINSQLDHLHFAQTIKRNEFHNSIIERFKQDKNFEYNRIELKYDPDNKIISRDIYKSLNLESATKKHIDAVLPYKGRAIVQYLSTPIQLGTFILIDDSKIIFQLDGVDFDTQVPSDLIILTVSNPKSDLMNNYQKKFSVLSQQAIPHTQI